MDVKPIIAKNLQDPVYFCRHFLEEWFPDEMPWVHRGLLAIMTRRCSFLPQYGEMDKILRHFVWSPNPFAKKEDLVEHPIFTYENGELHMTISPNTAVMMPRGFSKTTLCNGKNIWKALHNLMKFGLYVSESGPHAEKQLQNIKTQFESNELIRKVYGELKGKTWTADEILCSNGVYFAARGRGGQVRGLNNNGQRPDDITIDDMEDEESVLTDGQREKASDFLYKAVLPAVSRKQDDVSCVTMLGTLLHKEAVMMKVATDGEFNFIRFSAIDRDGDPLWAGNMTLDALERKKTNMATVGKLAAFYMEFMSTLNDKSTAKFKDVLHGEPDWSKVTGVAIGVDPAISEKPGADFFAIIVMVMTLGGTLWVVDSFLKKGVLPREQVDKIFELYQKWRSRLPEFVPTVGIESIAYQKALVHLTREEMFRKKCYFEITEIKGHEANKDTRIMGILQPRYANGYIKHFGSHPELETQLLDYPHGKKDGPDAEAMTVTLLDPHASSANADDDLAEDAYDDDEDLTLRTCP